MAEHAGRRGQIAQKNRPSDKLEEAIERGDVAKSQEINTFFVLGGFTLALLCSSAAGRRRSSRFDLRGFLMNAHQVPSDGGRAPADRAAMRAVAGARGAGAAARRSCVRGPRRRR